VVYYILRFFFTCNFANFDNFNDFAYFAYFDTILMIKIISDRTYRTAILIIFITLDTVYCLIKSERDIL
jgi:hypothetical protein